MSEAPESEAAGVRLMSIHKDYRGLVKRIKAVGWEMEETAKGHYKVSGGLQVVHCSMNRGSTDARAHKNIMAELRRAGLEEAEAKLAEREDKQREREAAEAAALLAEVEVRVSSNRQNSNHHPTTPPPQPLDETMLAMVKFGASVSRFISSMDTENVDSCVKLLKDAESIGFNVSEILNVLRALRPKS